MKVTKSEMQTIQEALKKSLYTYLHEQGLSDEFENFVVGTSIHCIQDIVSEGINKKLKECQDFSGDYDFNIFDALNIYRIPPSGDYDFNFFTEVVHTTINSAMARYNKFFTFYTGPSIADYVQKTMRELWTQMQKEKEDPSPPVYNDEDAFYAIPPLEVIPVTFSSAKDILPPPKYEIVMHLNPQSSHLTNKASNNDLPMVEHKECADLEVNLHQEEQKVKTEELQMPPSYPSLIEEYPDQTLQRLKITHLQTMIQAFDCSCFTWLRPSRQLFYFFGDKTNNYTLLGPHAAAKLSQSIYDMMKIELANFSYPSINETQFSCFQDKVYTYIRNNFPAFLAESFITEAVRPRMQNTWQNYASIPSLGEVLSKSKIQEIVEDKFALDKPTEPVTFLQPIASQHSVESLRSPSPSLPVSYASSSSECSSNYVLDADKSNNQSR